MRLFTAIEIPQDVKSEILLMRRKYDGVRFIPPEQIHLTLAFIGEREEKTLKPLLEVISEVKFCQFCVRIQGFGFFPNDRKPSVFWLGVKDNSPLKELKTQIDILLSGCGIQIEKRQFKPHVTVARISGASSSDIAKIAKNAENFDSEFMVSSFKLFSSQLKPEGAVHTAIAEFRCGDP